MAKIGFIGIGNMGLPMARNLQGGGHEVVAFDLSAPAKAAAADAGIALADSMAAAVAGADAVVSALPAGRHVRAAYLDEGGIVATAKSGATLIDCSTIDVDSARAAHRGAADAGLLMVDAPMSGGVGGAAAGKLTFMVGGEDAAVAAARPYLELMGARIVHCGGPGNGQAAKICNNMILGVTMIGVSEAFNLAEKLGLPAQKLFDVASTASGSCWALLNHCPAPGIVETAASNRDYKPGFAAAMMLKDLRLSQDCAMTAGAATPLGAQAAALYTVMEAAGRGDQDYSAIIELLKGR